MFKEPTRLSSDTKLSFSQIKSIIENNAYITCEDETSSSVMKLLKFAYKSIPGDNMEEKSKLYSYGKGNKAPRVLIDKDTLDLAKVGDGILRAIVTELEMTKHPIIKFPASYYQTNYYLSEVVKTNWPMFTVLFKDTHDFGTVYEWLIGLIWSYSESKTGTREFIQRTLFKNQHAIIHKGRRLNKIHD